jgi:ketosteroid isomerase-like protein
VLSEDALRRIGQVDRDLIEQRIRELFELWSHGDLDSVVGYLAADVKFPRPGNWSSARKPTIGREAAIKLLRQWRNLFENIVSVLHEIVIDGDRAVVHRTAVGRFRKSGERYQGDVIEFMRFRDGLIVEFTSYPDAALSRVSVE